MLLKRILNIFGVFLSINQLIKLIYNRNLAALSTGYLSPVHRPRKSSRDRSFIDIPPSFLAFA